MTTIGAIDAPAKPRAWRDRLVESLPFIAIFLITFVVNIAFSLRQGRLASVPIHDDVAYLADGLSRVIFVKGDGLWSAIGSLIVDPPHAPVTTLTAMFGFWALGPAPISAYIANGWVLALYVAVLAVLSRPLGGLLARTLFVAVLVFVPVAHAMVTEFRPDMAGGLLFALAIALMCGTDFRNVTIKRRIHLVLLALAATITKPSAVILTIPALGVAFAVAMVAQGLFTGRAKVRLLLSGLATVALYALALVPFAVAFGAETIRYIRDVLFTNSDIWATPGDRWFHWTYHFSGPGGTEALGVFGVLALVIVIVDLLMFVRFPSYRRPGVLPLYLTIAVVYCAMAVSTEKTVFQGSYFYLPLLFAAASAFVRIVVQARLRWSVRAPIGSDVVLASGLVLAILFLPLGGAYTVRATDGPEAVSLLPQISDAIFALNKNEWIDSPSCAERTMRITAINYDPITAGAIQMALAEGGLNVASDYVFFPRSLQDALKTIDDVDLVVMADPAAKPTNQWLLLAAMAPDIYRYLSEKPGVRKIQVGVYRNHPFWLFVKPHCEPVTPP
ncbi:hypothetical protein SAMN02745157_4291 [Kaistia soli DSM 19436]|uniref:Dolichyl-phosphate-mannose-protein mannosyltransferase n=1 Tax=Kaistia soli DSM 19436 TaxID=1122133 RepID=A0A1M5K536_9HYPH|nr:hypothetical protein [Kaistia soli]SHG47811.1 hypothetical protein SAMN02745157_4291 [Kaistia soli DSM 19436]